MQIVRIGRAGRVALAARWAVAALCLCCAAGQSQKKPSAGKTTTWQDAERLRAGLQARPAGSRTRADYDEVLVHFRAVYHDNPADLHAPMSIYYVAELLAEQGRSLHDPKSLQAAILQYEFLRTQYPASSLRTPALLAECQIEQNDLHDAKAAKARYVLLLEQAPHSNEAEEARAALAQMSRPAAPKAVIAADAPAPMPPEPPASAETAGKAPVQSRRPGELAQVTAIRHWSTPTYTRVVIDLGDSVTYEAARVPKPDRIYFDLHNTRLAPGLAGRNFTVTDDGFLKRIRAAQFRDQMARVVLDLGDVTEYTAFLLPDPYRLIIDIHGNATGNRPAGTGLPAEATLTKPGTAAKPETTAKPLPLTPVPNTNASPAKSSKEVAGLSTQPGRVDATTQPTSQPIAAVVAQSPGAPAATPKKPPPADSIAVEDALPARAAVPTASGQTSLVRALGLKIGRIVIDPGHGGHDSGTLGADGIEEKDIVLDVALRLGRLLHDRLNSEIIYTRSDDTFVALEDRTAIANKAQADLFLSIHANSSPDDSARGVETYYLNFTTRQDALEVAARENAVSGQSIHQLSDLVKKIALKDKIEESREFAGDVEQGLYGGLQPGNGAIKNRGVKKAPFVVLIGANMPSVLAEISFISNPRDAKQLQRPEYRQRVAEGLYKGVAKYAAGLSGPHAPLQQAKAP